jgi:chorismate lyase/3-hydroxybenzoate synthase
MDLEMLACCPIQIRHLEASQVAELLQTPQIHIGGLVCFGDPLSLTGLQTAHIPVTNIPLKPFKGKSNVEVWSGKHPFSYVQEKEFHMAYNPDFLFGSVYMRESSGVSLENLTCSMYQLILDQILALGFPHLLRVWNYFPDINRTSHGLERYQQFCIGRHKAFSSLTKEFHATLPAATAVGTPGGPLHIYFLAGKHPGVHIENPRQISAYEYPERYGPKSPSFARATMVKAENYHNLFVAGTASIVGHATQHPGNPSKQTQETLCNIDAVLGHAQEKFQVPMSFAGNQSLIKVYVRNREHLSDIQKMVTQHLGEMVQILYLQGDICRSDLLTEIEATFYIS